MVHSDLVKKLGLRDETRSNSVCNVAELVPGLLVCEPPIQAASPLPWLDALRGIVL